jgi:hypothetical protein
VKTRRTLTVAVVLSLAFSVWVYFDFVARKYQTFQTTHVDTGWVVTSYCRVDVGSMLWFAYLKIEDPKTSKLILEERLDVNLSADGPGNCEYYAPTSVLIDRKSGAVLVNTRSEFMPRVVLTLPESARSR